MEEGYKTVEKRREKEEEVTKTMDIEKILIEIDS